MTVLLCAQVSRAQEVDAAGQEIAAAQDQAGQPMEQPPVEASSVTVLDKITIVSTGDGGNGRGVGASQITNDVTKMIAQAPAIFEGLTGVKLADLLGGVPGLTERNGKDEDNGKPSGGAA